MKMRRIGRPKQKWMKLLVTVTRGRISAGKRIFLIRLPLIMRVLADSMDDEVNQTQGRIPQKRKRAYTQGELPIVEVARPEDEAEDDRIDDHQEERVDERPEEAEDRPSVAGLELPADQVLDENPVLVDFLEVSYEPTHAASPRRRGALRACPAPRRRAGRAARPRGAAPLMSALGQEQGGRLLRTWMNEAAAADVEPMGGGRGGEVVGAPGGIDEISPSARFEAPRRRAHDAQNIAFYLMFCNGFLGGGTQETGFFSDIWRVGEDDVEAPGGPVPAEVRPDDRDPILEPVQADVPPGQGGKLGLDLEGGQPGEGAPAEEKGDDPAPGAELEEALAFFTRMKSARSGASRANR